MEERWRSPRFLPPTDRPADHPETAPGVLEPRPVASPLLEHVSEDRRNSDLISHDQRMRDSTHRLTTGGPAHTEGIPTPSVPKWGRNTPESRPHVDGGQDFYQLVRPYDELATGARVNKGRIVPFTDVNYHYEQGQIPHGYLLPSTYAPEPDAHGRDVYQTPSRQPASQDSPRAWR
jgi:hypothetical protein